MKTITPLTSRVILRVSLDDARPTAGFNQQAIEEWFRNHYNFKEANQIPLMGQPGGIQLGATPAGMVGIPPGGAAFLQRPNILMNGFLSVSERQVQIQSLLIVPDFSFVALNVLTTEDGDLILDDMIQVLESEFEFRNLRSNATRHYGSSIVFEFDKPLEQLIEKLHTIQKIISQIFQTSLGVREDASIEKLAFRCDPSQIPASKAQFMDAFTIERRAGHEYSENRYFSGAPLKTSQHIEVLKNIEKELLT